MICTAKLNDLDPEAYLRDLLERTADHPVDRVADLPLWKLTQTTAAHAA